MAAIEIAGLPQVVAEPHVLGMPTPLLRSSVVLALLLAACTDTSSPPAPAAEDSPVAPATSGPRGSWAGRLDGTEAFVAVVADGTQIAAYICDSGPIAEWFFGAATGSDLTLVSSTGATLALSLADASAPASGVLRLSDGATHAFQATPSTTPVLFRADAESDQGRQIAGWIQIGTETRGSLALVSATGIQLRPAPALDLSGSPVVQALFPTPMTPSTLGTPTPSSTRFVWGAMGDSYAAGEGNPERGIADPSKPDDFSGLSWGNDTSNWIPIAGATQEADRLTCHRSDQAGAPKAQRALEALYPGVTFKLGFTACSGATTNDLLHDGYTGPGTRIEALKGNARVPQPAQIDRIRTFKNQQAGQLDAVYMSIGGNDIGFGEIISDCLFPFDVTPGGCKTKWEALIPQKLETLGANYRALDDAIRDKLGNMPILRSDYPNPLHNGSNLQDPPVCHGDDFAAHGEVGFGAPDDFLKNNLSTEEAVFAFGLASAMNSVMNRGDAPSWTRVPAPTSSGRGLCTGTPSFNLNSAGLHRQGHDMDVPLFVVSGGLLHPNDRGYEGYAASIVGSLRPLVDARVKTGLGAPTGVRIGAAVRDLDITLHWNDRATAENAFQVEVLPARPEDAAAIIYPHGAIRLGGGGFIVTLTGTNTQSYAQQVGQKAMFKYRVRACNTGVVAGAGLDCGSFSPQVVGANFAPKTPTGLGMSTATAPGAVAVTTFSWAAQPGALEYVVRAPAEAGGREIRSTSTTAILIGTATSAQVAACNRVGCSPFSAKVP